MATLKRAAAGGGDEVREEEDQGEGEEDAGRAGGLSSW